MKRAAAGEAHRKSAPSKRQKRSACASRSVLKTDGVGRKIWLVKVLTHAPNLHYTQVSMYSQLPASVWKAVEAAQHPGANNELGKMAVTERPGGESEVTVRTNRGVEDSMCVCVVQLVLTLQNPIEDQFGAAVSELRATTTKNGPPRVAMHLIRGE